MRRSAIGIAVFAAAWSFEALAVSVSINHGTEYQTIEGFGTMMKQDIGPQDSVDANNATYRQLLTSDLGLSVIRVWVPMDMEPTNDNADANVINRAAFRLNGSGNARWTFHIINKYKSYPNMKFIASVLSPPAWMKDNGSTANGKLLTTMREELAEYLVAYCRIVKDSTGVDLYGISLQNESAFDEWYGSCVYTAWEYRDMLKVLGARFEREGIVTKLHGADDMLNSISTNPYFGVISQDTAAKRYISAITVHGYTDGVNPMPTSGAAQAWGRLGTAGRAMGKATWMTECAGWASTDAMSAGLHIGMALKHGNVSMWVYLDPDDCDVWGLLCNGQHTARSAASKNYYHWVKPGAVRIDATYTDAHVLVTAFRHKTDRTLTVVAVNDTVGTRYVKLNGSGLPATMQKFTTTQGASPKLCVDEGAVNTADSIAIDAYSVVTLYGTNYDPPVGVVTPSTARPAATKVRPTGTRWFLPNGCVLSGSPTARSASGVVIRVSPRGVSPVVDALHR
jgi:glucuronoarabinoxylan endo-1,4-beta-xylanase